MFISNFFKSITFQKLDYAYTQTKKAGDLKDKVLKGGI